MVRIPFDFNDGDGPRLKMFVVLGHKINGDKAYAICAKTTSKLDRLKADDKLLRGVVVFKPGEIACFPLETAIEPDNQFAIEHWKLERYHSRGELEVLHVLDSSFAALLTGAIENSVTIQRSLKLKLLAFLDSGNKSR